MSRFSKDGDMSWAPPASTESITPNDSTDLTDNSIRGLSVNVDGNVALELIDDTTSVIVTLTSGQIHPMRIGKVLATGTTATGIIGWK